MFITEYLYLFYSNTIHIYSRKSEVSNTKKKTKIHDRILKANCVLTGGKGSVEGFLPPVFKICSFPPQIPRGRGGKRDKYARNIDKRDKRSLRMIRTTVLQHNDISIDIYIVIEGDFFILFRGNV